MSDLTLTGFSDSVYSWAARLGLTVCRLDYAWREVNPFEEGGAEASGHPFGEVPVLQHSDFTLYETAAILHYAHALAPETGIVPEDARACARVQQVVSLTNAHVYRPCVRQVYSHGVYRRQLGATWDESMVADGLARAGRALDALETVAEEGLVLRREAVDAAALLLLPMLVMFSAYPQAREMLKARAALWSWFTALCAHEDVRATCPARLKGDLVT